MLALTDSQFKADIPPKPKVLPVQFENVPPEIKARRRWVVWRCELRQDKKGGWRWTKVPYQACPPPPDELFWPRAKSNDPLTWASYDAALETYLDGGWDGIGFMLGDDHAGVDCDKCINPEGAIEPWAEEVVRQINSYTEISPSGTGCKILALGKLPEGRRRTGRLEMYSEKRFFAVTGHWLPGTPRTVEPRQNQLLELHARVFPQGQAKGNRKERPQKDPAHAEGNGHRPFGVEKEPPTLKAALRLFLKRIRDHYGDPGAVKKHPSKKYTYQCRCPAHDDSTPSLSVTLKNGRLVFHCLATSGCDFTKSCKALDFKPEWCFAPVTVKRLARAKKLPAEFLASLGCKDWHRQVVIPYYDGHGHKVCVRLRVALKKREGQETTTYQQKGKPLHIYGEWPDRLIPRSDEVVFVEGETDTWTLWLHGIPALGIPGATAAKVIEPHHLEGLKRVYVWREPDLAGAGFVAGVLGRLRFLKFTGDVLALQHGQYKDPSALHIAAPDFQAAWQEVVAQARSGEELPPRTEKPGNNPYRFEPTTSAVFDATRYNVTWLLDELLVRGAPAIIGGPRKALKTSLLVDLCLSVGTGEPFLGHFPVAKPARIILISGESGEFTLQETARRVCAAKHIRLCEAENCLWGFRLPQLSVDEQLDELRRGLQQYQVEVAVIDPLYLCLLAGIDKKQISAANLYDMGPLLLNVARTTLDVGCTPLLVHHTRKNLNCPYEPLDLEDLAFAGVQEFARQWLLINRRAPYQPGTGFHELWLSAGGSCGHGGLWGLEVREGVLKKDFTGRIWQPTIMSLTQAKERKQAGKEQQKARKQDQDKDGFLRALDRTDRMPTKTELQHCLGWDNKKFCRVYDQLKFDRLIEEVEVKITVGNGAKREAKGVRRVSQNGT
jgi:replicative DNA helicase